MSDLPAGAIEAGADALVRLRTQVPCLDELPEADQCFWLRDARAVLEAALPRLVALKDGHLTPAERAAMHTDLHAATCSLPLLDCIQCRTELGTIRRIVGAAGPVLEEEARADERASVLETLREYEAHAIRGVCSDGSDKPTVYLFDPRCKHGQMITRDLKGDQTGLTLGELASWALEHEREEHP